MNTAWPSQAEPPQAGNTLEVGEEHLDFLAARLGLWIEFRRQALAGKFPHLFETLAGEGTCIDLRTALLFCRADAAKHLAGAIFTTPCSRDLGRVNLTSRPVLGLARILLLDIRDNQACVDRKALTTKQSFFHAMGYSCLEDMAQQVALQETTVAVLRNGRMVRDTIRQVEATKLAAGQVEVRLFTEPPL